MHIFVKDRGFPPGDPRRCRANLGGARPGYFGHEFEMRLIPWISRGLDALARSGSDTHLPFPPLEESPVLDVQRLKQLIDAEVP